MSRADDYGVGRVTSDPRERAWLIHFEDASRPVEVFLGADAEGCALARSAEVGEAWTHTLFVEASPRDAAMTTAADLTPLSELERLADDGDEAGAALRQAATNLATIRPIDSQFRELAFSDEDVSIGEAAENWECLLRKQGRAALNEHVERDPDADHAGFRKGRSR